MLLAKAESFFSNVFNGGAVSKQTHVFEPHALTRLQGLRHCVRINGFHTNDLDFRAQAFDVGGNTGNQATTADAAKDGMNWARMLTQDLHADGALPGNHVWVVKRMHKGEFFCFFEFQRMRISIIKRFPGQHYFTTQVFDRLNLDFRGRGRHHNHSPTSKLRS